MLHGRFSLYPFRILIHLSGFPRLQFLHSLQRLWSCMGPKLGHVPLFTL